MVVGDFGYIKKVELLGDRAVLDPITNLRVVVERPGGTAFAKSAIKDGAGNWTWVVEQGDFTEPGQYQIQAFDLATGRRIGTKVAQFTVGKSLE